MMSSEPHQDRISPFHFSRERQDNHATNSGYRGVYNFTFISFLLLFYFHNTVNLQEKVHVSISKINFVEALIKQARGLKIGNAKS